MILALHCPIGNKLDIESERSMRVPASDIMGRDDSGVGAGLTKRYAEVENEAPSEHL